MGVYVPIQSSGIIIRGSVISANLDEEPKKQEEPKETPTNCKNCGAPLENGKCKYCGTEY